VTKEVKTIYSIRTVNQKIREVTLSCLHTRKAVVVIQISGVLSVLLNDTVKCWDYSGSVIDKQVHSTGRMTVIQQNLHNQRKICLSATLSIINSTWADLGSNLGRLNNYLSMSHVTALKCCCTYFSKSFSVYLNDCDLGAEIILCQLIKWIHRTGWNMKCRILNSFCSSQNFRMFKICTTYMAHNLTPSFTIHYGPKTKHAYPNNL
jgi:hypothetical protein